MLNKDCWIDQAYTEYNNKELKVPYSLPNFNLVCINIYFVFGPPFSYFFHS